MFAFRQHEAGQLPVASCQYPAEPKLATGNRQLTAPLQLFWLNTMFWTLSLIVTAVFAVVGGIYITAFAACVRDHRRTLWLLRRTISHYGSTIIKCAWPMIKVRFVDHAPNDRPPFVFVANHRSTCDAYLMACLPFECIQVVNIWPFRIPLLGIMARLAGYLSVREMPIEQFVERGSRLLGEGVSVITFPEGTRSRTAEMGPFRGSAFQLAQDAGARIAPLAIVGSDRAIRRGSWLLRPSRIAVHKLPAVMVDEYRLMSRFKLKTLVRERIQRHLNEIERGAA